MKKKQDEKLVKKVIKHLEKNLTADTKKQGKILEDALHSEEYFHKPLAVIAPPAKEGISSSIDSYLDDQASKKAMIADSVAKSLNENLDSAVIQQLQSKGQELR